MFNLRWLLEGCVFMSGGLKGCEFCDFEPTWLHLGGPRGSKIEAKTRKNRCQKAMRFSPRFFSGSGLVLEGFWRRFWMEKLLKIAKVRVSRNPWKYAFSLWEIDIFRVSTITKMQTNVKNACEKSMFFWTSFLEAFHVLRTYRRAAGGKRKPKWRPIWVACGN